MPPSCLAQMCNFCTTHGPIQNFFVAIAHFFHLARCMLIRNHSAYRRSAGQHFLSAPKGKAPPSPRNRLDRLPTPNPGCGRAASSQVNGIYTEPDAFIGAGWKRKCGSVFSKHTLARKPMRLHRSGRRTTLPLTCRCSFISCRNPLRPSAQAHQHWLLRAFLNK